jgi:hypothetical protein
VMGNERGGEGVGRSRGGEGKGGVFKDERNVVGGKGSNPIGVSVPMDGLHTKNGLPTHPVHSGCV